LAWGKIISENKDIKRMVQECGIQNMKHNTMLTDVDCLQQNMRHHNQVISCLTKMYLHKSFLKYYTVQASHKISNQNISTHKRSTRNNLMHYFPLFVEGKNFSYSKAAIV
jgi:hypothetical protein